jgi:serine protease Do
LAINPPFFSPPSGINNMRAPILLAAFFGISFLTGCATNPYAQFYQSYTNQWPVAVQQRLLPHSGEPQIIASSNLREDGRHLQEQGYIPIGISAFSGGMVGQQQLIWQAKAVSADAVLYSSQFSRTESGVMPLLSYQPGQTYTTQTYGTANAYGSGGYAYGNYSGTSTTTTPGTLGTQYVPYLRQVYDQGAIFWRRMKPGIFGARFAPIPDAMRSTLQRNTGVLVDIVMTDSPAFRANVLEGDVIIQIANKPIETVQQFTDLLPSYVGQKVPIRVIRGSQTLDIDVQL